MSAQPKPKVWSGSCHCGAVTFRVKTATASGLDCNCSICSMKGYLHLIIPWQEFELLAGEDNLQDYRFNTGRAQHRFCRTCGIHPFYVPRSHPHKVDVNIRCIDAPPGTFSIEPFDGANWERNIANIANPDVEVE